MFRLYKRDETGRIAAYHEAWAEPERRRIVEHWGMVGTEGETEVHRIWFFGSLEKQFNSILDPARALGFAELVTSDFTHLIVEYALGRSPNDDDLGRRLDIEERLNEVLGWTGLGECDRGAMTPDSMEAICEVVDFDLAKSVIEDALKDSDFEDYSRIYQE
ncbi:MAG: hypothetical protein AAFZ91_09970 [Pseudomonadota bacterium]